MASFRLLLLQFIVIIGLARLLGAVFKKIHQPQVIGEVVAGMLLGPTVLGAIAPRWSEALFPAESLVTISLLSQIGILLFMFTIGLELNLSQVRAMGRQVVLISNVSIVAPFVLGTLVAFYLYPSLSNSESSRIFLPVFVGAAMSITAFPVLARILAERRLLDTKVGNVALACAAVDDVSAWCILAVIVALVQSTSTHMRVWFRLACLPVYVVLMIWAVRSFLGKLFQQRFAHESETVTLGSLALISVYVFASALITDWLGVHALFGAFMAGVVFPVKERFAAELGPQLRLTSGLLLPLFFAISGLRTNVGLIRGWQMWLICGLLLLVAVAGKLLASMLASRYGGMSWRDSTALGVLLNTRGLVELIILNIGLELHVLPQKVFSMMVLMALTTTLMAAPLLHRIYADENRLQRVPAAEM